MRQSEKLYDVYVGELLAQDTTVFVCRLVIIFFLKKDPSITTQARERGSGSHLVDQYAGLPA